MKGKFIVMYGANNLGKSLQIGLLEKYLREKQIPVKRIKYPIYDLEPTGPLINQVLRQGKEMAENKVQKLYVQNRKDYEAILKEDLEKGIWVLAEDYRGTGIAWGIVRGLDREELEDLNENLYPEDIAFVFTGERFLTGKEANHRNETNDALWKKAYAIHMILAASYGWVKIHANQKPEAVHHDIVNSLVSQNILL